MASGCPSREHQPRLVSFHHPLHYCHNLSSVQAGLCPSSMCSSHQTQLPSQPWKSSPSTKHLHMRLLLIRQQRTATWQLRERDKEPGDRVGEAIPWESGAHVKAIHVLADQEFQDADPLQPQQSHVSLGGSGTLEGGIKFWGEPLLFHSPDTIGPPTAVGTERVRTDCSGSERTAGNAPCAQLMEEEGTTE